MLPFGDCSLGDGGGAGLLEVAIGGGKEKAAGSDHLTFAVH